MHNDRDRDRGAAWALLNEFMQSPQLIKHSLGVEAAMRWYARHYGEDETWWGNVGLLHDFDYERWPSLDDHPFRGSEVLAERGYSQAFRETILSHADYSGVPRDQLVRRVLFAVDELTGLVAAVALVRPSRSVLDLEAKSVLKKMKDRRFAAGVSREDVVSGAAGLGLALDTHISQVIAAMQMEAGALGLDGGAGAADG